MKDHLNRYLLFLVLGFMALVSICADTMEYPGLDVTWSFNAGNESFSVGFTDKKPAAELNQGWDDVKNSMQLNMRDFIQNSATFHKARARVYVYWNFFSNESLTVSVSSTGPLTVAGMESINDNNKINWIASWTPMGVTPNGDIIELTGQTVSIGRDDNIFTTSSQDYSPKVIFSQVADDYPLKSKYGYARIDIETQDTKASDIPNDHHKVKGIYTTSLILDVQAR